MAFRVLPCAVLIAVLGCGGDDDPAPVDGGALRDAGEPLDTGPTDDTTSATDAGPTCTPVAAHPISTVSPTSNAREVSLVATDAGYAAAWHDTTTGAAQIRFVRLDAAGVPIGDELRVTNDEGASASPTLVWTGTEHGIAWYDDRDGDTEIYFTRIAADGTEIGDDARVTMDGARSEFPSLAWNGDGYGLVWNDTRPGTFQIYFARLDTAGVKVGGDVRVSTSTALAASPRLTYTGDGYGVAWHDNRDMMGLQIYFARIGADGALIGTETRLSAGGNASIARSGSEYGVAWPDNPAMGGEIQLARLDASGAVSGAPAAVTETTSTARAASLVAAPDGWAIAWADRREADAEIHLVTLNASGVATGSAVRASEDTTDSLAPSLVAAHGSYAVAWHDASSDMMSAIYFATVCP